MLSPIFRRCVVMSCLIGGLFLSGCFSSEHVVTRFYVLDPLDSGVTLLEDGDQNDLALEVVSLHLPQYLERPQIVTRSSGNRLELAEFDQWGGNLRKNMRRVLAKNLSQLLRTPDISIYPRSPSTPPDFSLEVEVMRFERDPDGIVRLSTRWRLSEGSDRTLLATRITELASPRDQVGSDFGRTVSAMSGLMGELSRIIGQEIAGHIHGVTE